MLVTYVFVFVDALISFWYKGQGHSRQWPETG